MNENELNIISELQRNGFTFAGICKPCGGRAKKYKKGQYMFKVFKSGSFKLFFKNQAISGYETIKTIQTFIQRTQEA